MIMSRRRGYSRTRTTLLETQMINIEKLMQPVLPPIKKRPTVLSYKTGTGLDKSVHEEITNVMGSR